MISKSQATNKIETLDYTKIGNFCASVGHKQQCKNATYEMKELFKNYVSEKDLICK